MTSAAVLTADNANISDTRYPTGSGADIWDDIITARRSPKTVDSVLTIGLILNWATLVRSGSDPNLEYRVVREVGGETTVILDRQILNQASAHSVRSPLAFPLIDKPGVITEVTYKLQARGVGYNRTEDDSYWVPPVTMSNGAFGTGSTYDEAVENASAAVSAPSCSGSNSESSTSVTTHSQPPTSATWVVRVVKSCTTPGHWAGGSTSIYTTSTGAVRFNRGTGINVTEGLQSITENQDD